MNPRGMAAPIAALFTSLFMVALVTTFVLPGRPSPAVIKAFFTGLTGAIKSTLGLGMLPTTAVNPAIGGAVLGPVPPPGYTIRSGHVVPIVSGQTGQLVQSTHGGIQ